MSRIVKITNALKRPGQNRSPITEITNFRKNYENLIKNLSCELGLYFRIPTTIIERFGLIKKDPVVKISSFF